MARQSNGNYLQPANTAAISSQSISSTAFNALITDIGTEITNSVDRGGRSAMTAALPMGGQKITGMADPAASTDGATKNYVDTTTAAFFSTGDVKLTIKTVADAGWVLLTSPSFGNGTIGSSGSGANLRANADTQALFNLVFNNYSDANAPLLTSGGAATTRAAQTNAATAWAANCRIQIGFFAGRALGIAGNPPDLPSNRNLGDHPGEETHTLTLTEIPTGITSSGTNTINVNSSQFTGVGGSIFSSNAGSGTGFSFYLPGGAALNVLPSTGNNAIGVASNNTSGGAHNNMQPTSFINAMIKL